MIDLIKEAQKLFIKDGKASSYVVDPLLGTLFLVSKKFQESDENIILYASNSYEANNIYNNIIEIVDKDNVVLFPSDDLLFNSLGNRRK